MKRDGFVVMLFTGFGFVLGMLSLPGCGDGDVRTVPEAVKKANKDDVDKAKFEADKKPKTKVQTKDH
jgi:hypothetical protein